MVWVGFWALFKCSVHTTWGSMPVYVKWGGLFCQGRGGGETVFTCSACTHTTTQIYMYMYTCTCTETHTLNTNYMYTHTCTCTHPHTHTHTHTHTHRHTHTHTHTHTRCSSQWVGWGNMYCPCTHTVSHSITCSSYMLNVASTRRLCSV